MVPITPLVALIVSAVTAVLAGLAAVGFFLFSAAISVPSGRAK